MKYELLAFPSNLFTFQFGRFNAEASDLGNRHLQPLYDDACDVGFAIQSSKTGKTVVYVLVHTEVNADDEICYWEYEPTYDSIRWIPECANTRAMIFND